MRTEYFEVIIGKSRIENFVPSAFEEGRFEAAYDAVPAVKEEEFHCCLV